MLHLSAQTYNNEQVSKIFRQNISWNMPRNGLFWQYILKVAKRWGSSPDPRLDSINREYANTILRLNISVWCRCLAILEQNETLLFYIFWSPSCTKIVFAPLGGLIFIDTANKFNILQKNWNIARNIMCFIMNVVIGWRNFLAHHIYLSFSKFIYRQNMFLSKNLIKPKYA